MTYWINKTNVLLRLYKGFQFAFNVIKEIIYNSSPKTNASKGDGLFSVNQITVYVMGK